MWRVSYIEDDIVKIKSGFKSDKEADEWVCSREKESDFVPLKLLVWSELLQCYKVVEEYEALNWVALALQRRVGRQVKKGKNYDW